MNNTQIPGTAAVSAAVAPALQRVLAGRAFDSYGLVAYFANLAAGATESVTVSVPSNSDLVAVAMTGTVVEQAAPGTVVAVPPVTLQIRGTGNDRNFYNVPVHLRNVVGTGSEPAPLVPFRMLQANSSVTFTASNLGATDYTLWLTMLCLQVFHSDVRY